MAICLICMIEYAIKEHTLDVTSTLFLYIQKEYVFYVSHNTTLFSLFVVIQADEAFRPLFLDHPQVTRYIIFEEAIQYKS
jgi:hypothetical protein